MQINIKEESLNILLIFVLLLSQISAPVFALKKSEEVFKEELSNAYDVKDYSSDKVVSLDDVFFPNKIQVYGGMSGDRWKAYNSINTVFGVDNPNDYLDFKRLVDRIILAKKSSFGGACDISEMMFGDPWIHQSPVQGRYKVSNYHATACQNKSELLLDRYNTSAAKYGYMFQFCSAVFFGGYQKPKLSEGEVGPLLDVVENLKGIVELKTQNLNTTKWTKKHTEVLYKHFYPSYKIKAQDLEDLHDAICTGANCQYDESFEVLVYSLCTDARWIDI